MSPRRSRASFCLAAALLAGAAARSSPTPGAAPPEVRTEDSKESSRTVPDTKAAAPAVRVERHSPPDGYPSLGPAGAGNTLIFFTDYQ